MEAVKDHPGSILQQAFFKKGLVIAEIEENKMLQGHGARRQATFLAAETLLLPSPAPASDIPTLPCLISNMRAHATLSSQPSPPFHLVRKWAERVCSFAKIVNDSHTT